MKIKKTDILALAAIFGLLCACQKNTSAPISAPKAVGNFNFTVLKAGQADATVLMTENHSIIIDCGEKDDGDKVTDLLRENNISVIDCIFLTHFDKDHIGGFPKIADDVEIENIIVPNYEGHNDEYKKYIKSVEEQKLNVTVQKEDISFVLDDVLLEISTPKKSSYNESDNDYSLAISITHGNNTFFFAGDAEEERISEILSEFKTEYDFLKVPHHGRYNPNTANLIESLNPTYAVICDSKKNPADDKTVDILNSVGCNIYHTRDGDIHVLSNGEEIKISQ